MCFLEQKTRLLWLYLAVGFGLRVGKYVCRLSAGCLADASGVVAWHSTYLLSVKWLAVRMKKRVWIDQIGKPPFPSPHSCAQRRQSFLTIRSSCKIVKTTPNGRANGRPNIIHIAYRYAVCWLAESAGMSAVEVGSPAAISVGAMSAWLAFAVPTAKRQSSLGKPHFWTHTYWFFWPTFWPNQPNHPKSNRNNWFHHE